MSQNPDLEAPAEASPVPEGAEIVVPAVEVFAPVMVVVPLPI